MKSGVIKQSADEKLKKILTARGVLRRSVLGNQQPCETLEARLHYHDVIWKWYRKFQRTVSVVWLASPQERMTLT